MPAIPSRKPILEGALTKPEYFNVIRYYGEVSERVPQDIRRRRQLTLETMRRLGTPVLIKKLYNINDVSKEIATESVNYSTIYGQNPHKDDFTLGGQFCSVETQEGEWIDEEGNLQISPTKQEGWQPAPKYRGYGPGYLTYAILPDAPEDIFRATPGGALIHTQLSRTHLPWWPFCGDNDLLITCELNNNLQIVNTFERFQLKKVTPITMHGLDRMGQREFNANAAGNRFWIGQYCEANVVFSETDPAYRVSVDR